MIARPYANLAPERFRRPFGALLFVAALGCVATFALRDLAHVPTPWDQGVQNLFFFMMGLNFLVWPNDGGVSPLASRVIGGGLVTVLLFSFATYIIRHL
ncbi:hypothetical protein GCM10009087_09930 [Sphingomonas oligophenolica]|uniref:Uncharacterized protein n=1 Tax=Sphingomonas oligophenolica TaxID=301154 RepID=A0ABU9Y8L1_9SPHN